MAYGHETRLRGFNKTRGGITVCREKGLPNDQD
jgi:hypothetical protein